MMNGGHAATGTVVGAWVIAIADALFKLHLAIATGLEPLPWLLAVLLSVALTTAAYLLGALLGAGAALLPDIDSKSALVSTAGGPVTGLTSAAARHLSSLVYRLTRRKHDPDVAGEHRFLIHTWEFALLTGAVLWFGTETSPWVGRITTGVLLWLSLISLGWVLHDASVRVPYHGAREPFTAALTAASLTAALTHTGVIDLIAPLLPIIVALGMVTHDAGDGGTRWGIPWKGLIPHRCDRCRARYLAASCRLRRIPWHHCDRCTPARRQYPRCAMWDRNTNVPDEWVFTTGEDFRSERVVTWASLTGTAALTVCGAAGLLS